MAMIVQHNMTAMNANRQLGISTSALAKSTEKLSSGYRINRAADDAAGLAISEKMRSQIRGLDQASTNAADGISMIQTAEGALNESHSILQRMRELCVQAANGTETDEDRGNIQDEIEQLQEELDRIAADTEFNEMKLLDGSLSAASTGGSAAGPKFGIYDDQLKGFITSNVAGVKVSVSNNATIGGESAVWSTDGKTMTLNLAQGMTYTQSEIDELIREAKQEDSSATGTPADISVSLKYGSLTIEDSYTSDVTVAGVRGTTENVKFNAATTLDATNLGGAKLTVMNTTSADYKITIQTKTATDPGKEAATIAGDAITVTLSATAGLSYTQEDINNLIAAAKIDGVAVLLDKPITTTATEATTATTDVTWASQGGIVVPDSANAGQFLNIAQTGQFVGADNIALTSNKYGADTNVKVDIDFSARAGQEECTVISPATYDSNGKIVTPAVYSLSLSSGTEYTEEDIEWLKKYSTSLKTQ